MGFSLVKGFVVKCEKHNSYFSANCLFFVADKEKKCYFNYQ